MENLLKLRMKEYVAALKPSAEGMISIKWSFRKVNQIHRHEGNLILMLRVSCQNIILPKGFGMENKSKPRICSVCYRFLTFL